MNTYIAKFRGRQRSALGVTYDISCTITGKDKDEARMNLYNHYDHLSPVQLEEIAPNVYCEMLSVYDNLKHLGYTTSDVELSKNSFEKNVLKDGDIVFTGTASEVLKFLKAKHK